MIGIINDIHFGARNDSGVFLENQLQFLKNVFFPELLSNNIETLFILGDIFEKRKSINFNILSRVYVEFFDRLAEHNIDVIILVGNHDVYYTTTNTLNSPELLLVKQYPNVQVYTSPTIVTVEDTPIALVPWVNSENINDTLTFIQQHKTDIMFGHFDIMGYMMHKNTIACVDGFDPSVFDGYKLVLSGHYHHKSTNSKHNIHYLGAPTQFTWNDVDDERGFHLLDLDSNDLTYVKNPYNMFYRVAYDADMSVADYDYESLKEKYVQVVIDESPNESKFQIFMSRIDEQNPQDLTIVDNSETDINDAFDVESIETEDTLMIVNAYINETHYDLDKSRMKATFQSLYNESLN